MRSVQPHRSIQAVGGGWGPGLATFVSWGPVQHAAPRDATRQVLAAAGEDQVSSVIWLDESTQVAVTVHYNQASDEQLLEALEQAAARLRRDLALPALPKRKAA